MANSIDWGTLALGAVIGVGCRRQIKSAAKVAATTAASLAATCAATINSVAAQVTEESQKTQSPQGNGQSNG